MRIGEAAAAAHTTPRALRFYEQRGLLPEPDRTASGQRDYAPADIELVRAIRELLALGLTIEDLARHPHRLQAMALNPDSVCGDTARGSGTFSDVVASRLDALDAEIARLTRLRGRLARKAQATAQPGAAVQPPRPSPPP